MKIKWRIQKNRQNNQELGLKADNENPVIDSCHNAFAMVKRKKRLRHSMKLPMAIYANAKGEVRYLTAAKLAEVLRKAARLAYPEMPEHEISLFSAHSIRVWACVLLDEAGKKSNFIQSRLRWMGDSYKMYLRDTDVISEQHLDVHKSSNKEVMKLIGQLNDQTDLPTEGETDTEMGEYSDIIQ